MKTARDLVSYFSYPFPVHMREGREKGGMGESCPVKTFYQITMFYLLDLLTLSFIIIFCLISFFSRSVIYLNLMVLCSIKYLVSYQSHPVYVLMGFSDTNIQGRAFRMIDCNFFPHFFGSRDLHWKVFKGWWRVDWGKTYIS